MIKVAIMQPTYLPWIGYFALMDSVDIFVILDSVQFSKRSWQQRNMIKAHSGPIWLTIPVMTKGKRDQLIRGVNIDYSRKFPKNHIDILVQSYQKSPFFNEYADEIIKIMEQKKTSLSFLTIDLILLFRNLLNINTPISYSTELSPNGVKDEMLASLCYQLDANEYISPIGAKEYLDDSKFFRELNIGIKYFEYNHPKYNQINGEFAPYMSIVDLLFNAGKDSLSILRQGLKSE
jgi:hypothetical protein